jgi:enoyl-CoA hydratase
MGEPTGVVRFEISGPIAFLTIDRPEARNALNGEVIAEAEQALDRLAGERAVRVLVLGGAGERAFCAGADLDELRGLSAVEAREHLHRGHRLLRRLETLGRPTIAAVRGWALGGGFELALACSLVVSSETARFGLPEAKLGLMPGYGGTQRLTRAVGAKAALAIMLTGEPIAAERAWQLGLLARPPVPDDGLDAAVLELAQAVAACSPSSLASILELVDAASFGGLGLDHEAAVAGIAIASLDASEGVTAFLEKRPPSFGERA